MPHGQFQEYMEAKNRTDNRIVWGIIGVLVLCAFALALAGCDEPNAYGIGLNIIGRVPTA